MTGTAVLVVIDETRFDYRTCPRCRRIVPLGHPGYCSACRCGGCV